MSNSAHVAANQKPTVVIHGFLGVLRNTNNNANAVKAAVYLLKPARPSKMPVMIQSLMPKRSWLNQRSAINMRPRLKGANKVSGSKPIAKIWGMGAAIIVKTAINPHKFADGNALVR